MVTARAALLQALREGPAYGRELARRIARATSGRVRFAEGSIYPALRRLLAGRLVRRWSVVPGRRRGGRARRYYELTERGVRSAEADRAELLRLIAAEGPRIPDAEERERMRARIELGAELSEEVSALTLHVPRRRGRAA
jgi:DNA-binding PadR family transcriptional regulator